MRIHWKSIIPRHWANLLRAGAGHGRGVRAAIQMCDGAVVEERAKPRV
jgi:hypothetical protein